MAQCYRNSGSLKNGMAAQAHRTSGSFAPRLFSCFDEGENFHFDHNVFCIPQETDWQKARYEENIVNDSQWLELIQYETQNPNWRDHVTEKLCKFVGVTI